MQKRDGTFRDVEMCKEARENGYTDTLGLQHRGRECNTVQKVNYDRNVTIFDRHGTFMDTALQHGIHRLQFFDTHMEQGDGKRAPSSNFIKPHNDWSCCGTEFPVFENSDQVVLQQSIDLFNLFTTVKCGDACHRGNQANVCAGKNNNKCVQEKTEICCDIKIEILFLCSEILQMRTEKGPVAHVAERSHTYRDWQCVQHIVFLPLVLSSQPVAFKVFSGSINVGTCLLAECPHQMFVRASHFDS